jgi:P22 coat protein - gene protein 5
MANALVTSTVVTNEVLRIAHNASAFLGNMNTDYDDKWQGQYKPGQTVNARRPVQFTHRTGSTANIQDITESSVPVTVQPELGIDFAVSSNDLALAVGSNGNVSKEFKQRYLQPAGLKIAAILDYSIASIIKNGAHQMVGTPGTPPSSITDILNAQVPLDRMSVPRDGMRMAAIEPGANASVVSGLATLFNNQAMLGDQYKSGVLKTGLGLDFIMSQNVPSHTVGPLGGTPLVNGASQGLINAGTTDNPFALTTSLVTNGWTAAAAVRLNQGDTFTLAGVFSVNPETKASTGVLQSFVVVGPTSAAPGPVSSDASGNLTMAISPAIIAGGAFQNVTARPASGAAITITSGAAGTTYTNNIIWHRDAVTFVSPKQELPGGMDMAYQASMADEGSISLRFVRGFDISANRFISRFDVLWGAAVTLPNFVVRRTN